MSWKNLKNCIIKRLNILNDNMKYDTSVNTQIHEMNHMHLDNATTLGNVLKMLEMERCCTPSRYVSSLLQG